MPDNSILTKSFLLCSENLNKNKKGVFLKTCFSKLYLKKIKPQFFSEFATLIQYHQQNQNIKKLSWVTDFVFEKNGELYQKIAKTAKIWLNSAIFVIFLKNKVGNPT